MGEAFATYLSAEAAVAQEAEKKAWEDWKQQGILTKELLPRQQCKQAPPLSSALLVVLLAALAVSVSWVLLLESLLASQMAVVQALVVQMAAVQLAVKQLAEVQMMALGQVAVAQVVLPKHSVVPHC